MPKEHLFTAKATWQGLDDGTGRVSAPRFDAGIALPEEFGGSATGTNAEELLLAALASCLAMTLAYILEAQIAETPQIRAEVEGKFATGPLRLTSVAVNLIVGPTNATPDAIEVAVRQAEQHCMVSSIIRTTASIEVAVEVV